MEILAPLGNAADLPSIVEAGADAVYCGLQGFSSRPQSADLSLDEIRQASGYCQERGIKLNVAVNSCLHQERVEELKKQITLLSEYGVNAVIVSDFGIANYILCNLGRLQVHISTLAGVQNTATAKHLFSAGVSRVILSSNLALHEIAAIVRCCPGREFEVVAYGGVCFNDNHLCELPHGFDEKGMYFVGCKMPYSLESDGVVSAAKTIGGNQLAGERLVPIFREIGIESLKIEGRTRNVRYVVEATRRLRRAVDDSEEGEGSTMHYVFGAKGRNVYLGSNR